MINQVGFLRNGGFCKVYRDGNSVESRSLKLLTTILADAERFRTLWRQVDQRPPYGSALRPYRGNMFAPHFCYGRHRGPAPNSSHPAAVLMALLPTTNPTDPQSRWRIPLTLRPANMSDHAGQVSFPGGRCQPGESPEVAAYREYTEELGCPNEQLELIGAMPELYVYASRHRVVPLLGLGSEYPRMNPNAQEVDKVLLLELDHLMNLQPMVRTIHRGSMRIESIGFWLEGSWVWGATAMMLGELKNRLERIAQSQQ